MTRDVNEFVKAQFMALVPFKPEELTELEDKIHDEEFIDWQTQLRLIMAYILHMDETQRLEQWLKNAHKVLKDNGLVKDCDTCDKHGYIMRPYDKDTELCPDCEGKGVVFV